MYSVLYLQNCKDLEGKFDSEKKYIHTCHYVIFIMIIFAANLVITRIHKDDVSPSSKVEKEKNCIVSTKYYSVNICSRWH